MLNTTFRYTYDEVYEKPIIIDGVVTDYTINKDGGVMKVLPDNSRREQVPFLSPKGYYMVTLSYEFNGRMIRTALPLHRLLARAFIPNPDPTHYNVVNHIDGNKENFSLNNLEWCTQRYNIIHSYRTGLNPHSILNIDQIKSLCEDIQDASLTQAEIAVKHNVPVATVRAVGNKEKYIDICNEYNFDKFIALNHIKNRQVVSMCKHLERGELSIHQIAMLHGVTDQTVQNLATGLYRTDVSKYFDFSKVKINKKSRLTDEDVLRVADLLMANTDMREISDLTGIPYLTIIRIKDKDMYKHVTEGYDFSNYQSTKCASKAVIEEICDYLQRGTLSMQEIANKLHVDRELVRTVYYRRAHKKISKNYDFSKYTLNFGQAFVKHQI